MQDCSAVTVIRVRVWESVELNGSHFDTRKHRLASVECSHSDTANIAVQGIRRERGFFLSKYTRAVRQFLGLVNIFAFMSYPKSE